MDTDGLKSILNLMPKIFYDEQMLKNALRRTFQDNKRAQNILYIVIESGVIDNALLIGNVNKNIYEGYVDALYNDYGIEKSIGKIYIRYWMEALGIPFENFKLLKETNLDGKRYRKDDDVGDDEVTVEKAFDQLTQSEQKAAVCIIDELDESEGVIVASQIADRYYVTRSTIVNALKKLELAGILESRSLGPKGTYIKIKNDDIIDVTEDYKRNIIDMHNHRN